MEIERVLSSARDHLDEEEVNNDLLDAAMDRVRERLSPRSGEVTHASLLFPYIPLISRVRGPYGKLWTEFFPSFYGPSAKRAGHENKEGKNEDP